MERNTDPLVEGLAADEEAGDGQSLLMNFCARKHNLLLAVCRLDVCKVDQEPAINLQRGNRVNGLASGAWKLKERSYQQGARVKVWVEVSAQCRSCSAVTKPAHKDGARVHQVSHRRRHDFA